MDNNLKKIQNIIIKQLEELDNLDHVVGVDKKIEISKANAICQNATAFIKSVNIGIKVFEMSNKYLVGEKELKKNFGIVDEK